jgi:hypothetical protein
MIEHLPLLAIYIKTKDLNADRKLMKKFIFGIILVIKTSNT